MSPPTWSGYSSAIRGTEYAVLALSEGDARRKLAVRIANKHDVPLASAWLLALDAAIAVEPLAAGNTVSITPFPRSS